MEYPINILKPCILKDVFKIEVAVIETTVGLKTCLLASALVFSLIEKDLIIIFVY